MDDVSPRPSVGVREPLVDAGEGGTAGFAEFVGWVGERGDVAGEYVRAATAALAEAVPDYEYRNVIDQLPDEYGPLLAETVTRDEVRR